jgi:hypothetical protein
VSCDLLPSESSFGPHIQGDVIPLLTIEWDLVIAHPPCTYLSVSGYHRTVRGLRDPQLTEDALEFVNIFLRAPLKRLALENPVGVISTRIRKPDQIIQPYQFGHDLSKKTCLWLKNLPRLKPTQYVPPRIVEVGEQKFHRWANQTDSGQNVLPPSEDRWKIRSRFFQGVADAMVNQWGPILREERFWFGG